MKATDLASRWKFTEPLSSDNAPHRVRKVLVILSRMRLHKDLDFECPQLATIPARAFAGPNPFPPSRYNRNIWLAARQRAGLFLQRNSMPAKLP